MHRVEVLVVDDSPDADARAGVDLRASLLRRPETSALAPRVRFVYPLDGSRERSTLGAKRNAAVRRSRGDLCVVWDDDDFFSPSRLKEQAESLAGGAGAVLLGEDEPDCLFYYDSADGVFRATEDSSFAQPCSMAFKRDLWGEQGSVYGDMNACEDLEFFESLLFRGVKVTTAYVPWVRTRHRDNVVQDVQGDGMETVVDATHVAATCDLPTSTLDFLLALPRGLP